MLTRTIEKEKRKCHEYWPSQGSVQHEPITVTLVHISVFPNFEERTFQIVHQDYPDEERFVNHYFFVSWPDHGTPCPHQLLAFIKRVNNQMSAPSPDAPVLVHCSAGVGRTGTYILLDVNMRRIEAEHNIDIYSYLRRIRSQRNFMVQTAQQYVFAHQCLLQHMQTSPMQLQAHQLREHVKYLQEATSASNGCNLDAEFRALQKFDRSSTVRTSEVGNAAANRDKNRFLNIVPWDETRVVLGVGEPTNFQHDYINASYVHGYSERYQFVATQAPLPHTCGTLWKMVWEKRCPIVACLCDSKDVDEGRMDRYWPLVGTTVVHEEVTIECTEEEQLCEGLLLCRHLRITNKSDGQSRAVKHFHHTENAEDTSGKSAESLIKLLGCVQRSYQENPSGSILVHCTSGVGRTGVLIALYNCIEQVRMENVIDVFHCVMELRYQRPLMVQTRDQYMLCYTVLANYLDSFDTYQNAI